MKQDIKIIDKSDLEYPKRLLQIQNPPEKLYIQGDYKLLSKDSIAIVGTRKYTEYGEKCASIFSKELSQKGVCIISGMAVGIDTIAHINSMEQIGKTIAVLGGGFNHIFPEENQYLYEEILENGGCVITEYEPDALPDKENFPKRNRIVSGLSMGVLVVEARYHSGSSITANLAKKQGKEVFCIPHPINTPSGYTPNFFIQNGAHLVMSSDDIYYYYYSDDVLCDEKQVSMEIPAEYTEIYNLIGQSSISVNEITRRLSKTVAEVTESLCIMEIEGYVKSLPGNFYVRAEN